MSRKWKAIVAITRETFVYLTADDEQEAQEKLEAGKWDYEGNSELTDIDTYGSDVEECE
jgi:hypothetical protein